MTGGTAEPRFTDRERVIIEHIFAEESNEDIAAALRCSVKTVEFHIGNILRKVGARSRVGLVLRLVAPLYPDAQCLRFDGAGGLRGRVES